jgi:hypothetical protein
MDQISAFMRKQINIIRQRPKMVFDGVTRLWAADPNPVLSIEEQQQHHACFALVVTPAIIIHSFLNFVIIFILSPNMNP